MISPVVSDIDKISPTNVVHSLATIQLFPYSKINNSKSPVYRISHFSGYSGPEIKTPTVLPIANDDPEASLIVIDDAGQGFRDKPSVWPLALKKNNKAFIILKMAYPLFTGKLWDALIQKNADRLIVMVSADDLRRSGINISRKLSWESTAIDFTDQMESNTRLLALKKCLSFIIRFSSDGAILYLNKQDKKIIKLFYDPAIGEEGFTELIPGMMNGVGSAFVAGVASKIVQGIEKIDEGINCGLMCARNFLEAGFGTDESEINYPGQEIFHQSSNKDSNFCSISLENNKGKSGVSKDWSILGNLANEKLETTAINFVKYGKDSSLNNVPFGKFHKLKVLDRSEIESYNSIKNLVREYIATANVHRPLSIAVFGSPGSGKSFGVTEVTESVAPGQLKRLEFNLSQFNSASDLNSSFHKVRDANLEGQMPIVFFDEFDSEFNGSLGWLKYFLKPMKDGKFTEGDLNHPLGRAIFVFAGGTCNSFEEFTLKESITPEKFKAAKGPDFVSRLRGFVNIKGINPVDKNDRLYILRRAFHLRAILERKGKHLVDKKQTVAIDPDVLNAFLYVPSYKHGIRSMSAIIEMSSLSKRKIFEKSTLPPPQQLELHTDSKKFYELIVK